MLYTRRKPEQVELPLRRSANDHDLDNNSLSHNVYDETRDMVELSALIYVVASLRRLYEQGIISIDNQSSFASDIIQEPLNAGDLLSILGANEFILRERFGNLRFETILDALERRMGNLGEDNDEEVCPTHFAVFDDRNHEQELVYAVVVNHSQKRITLIFRGTVTRTDALVDANFGQTELSNPVKGDDQPKTVGVHRGFTNYLFGSKNGTSTKFEKILGEVTSLVARYKDFDLYATGHSMGASLATLFAFHVASTPDSGITSPVICIPVASPKVGNLAFQKAFRKLEKVGRLKCLRVENSDDIVTEIPNPFNLLSSPTYHHVGIGLELSKEGSLRMLGATTPSPNNYGVLNLLPGILMGKSNVLENHSCPQYLQRLRKQKSTLRPMKLSMCMRRLRSVRNDIAGSRRGFLSSKSLRRLSQ